MKTEKTNNATMAIGRCLTFAMLFSPIAVLGVGFLDNDLEYAFEEGSDSQVYVSGLRNKVATDIVIPPAVIYEYHDYSGWNGKGSAPIRYRVCMVTRIGDEALGLNAVSPNRLSSVVVLPGPTNIGDSAFKFCTDLRSVEILNADTSIGASAFEGCIQLVNMIIPYSVTSIGMKAFYGCSRLASVTIGRNTIDTWWLVDANSLIKTAGGTSVPTSVMDEYSRIINDSISRINNNMNRGIAANIGDLAFAYCSALTSVIFVGNAPAVRSRVFEGVNPNCTAYVQRDSFGWGVEIPGVWNGIKIVYGDGPTSPTGTVTPTSGAATTANSTNGGTFVFSKAQTASGALYDSNGNLAGTVQVKAGRVNNKGIAKISATAMLINGKKMVAKPLSLNVRNGERSGSLVFRGIGDLSFEMADDGSFTLKGSGYTMANARIGGNLPNGTMTFQVDIDSLPLVGIDFEVIEDLLPTNVEVTVTGGRKLNAGKAVAIKYAKGRSSLAGSTDSSKSNVSGLKLTYTPKTGMFRGSFNIYASNESVTPEGKTPKLKKIKVNMTGIFADAGGGFIGVGEAKVNKPTVWPWTVTIR